MKRLYFYLIFLFLVITFFNCTKSNYPAKIKTEKYTAKIKIQKRFVYNMRTKPVRIIHVMVALCDCKNQSMPKVPGNICIGDKPQINLYWGMRPHGMKAYYLRHKNWRLVYQKLNQTKQIAERLVFRYTHANVYLVADCYWGTEIRKAVYDYFKSLSSKYHVPITLYKKTKYQKTIYAGGGADLLVYMGHNELLDNDFRDEVYDEETLLPYPNQPFSMKHAVAIGCFTYKNFINMISKTGAFPIITVKKTIAPEGYVIDGIIEGWIRLENKKGIIQRMINRHSIFTNLPENYVRTMFHFGCKKSNNSKDNLKIISDTLNFDYLN